MAAAVSLREENVYFASPRPRRVRDVSADVAALLKPHVDPRTAALVALGVVDFATNSEEGRPRFAELEKLDGFATPLIEGLQKTAENLLRAFDAFDRAKRPMLMPTSLEAECRARRQTLIMMLSKSNRDAVDAMGLRTVGLDYGPRALVCELRALAAFAERLGGEDSMVEDTRLLARDLERAVAPSDTREVRETRRALRIVWSVFEPLYREVAALGRELFYENVEAVFPALEKLATAEPRESIIPTIAALVQLNEASESNLWLGFSQDIADGGVFIATYMTHRLGTSIELDLQLPGSEETLKVSGVVHWVRGRQGDEEICPGVGVRLTNLSGESARALQAYAAQRTPIFYSD